MIDEAVLLEILRTTTSKPSQFHAEAQANALIARQREWLRVPNPGAIYMVLCSNESNAARARAITALLTAGAT